MLAGNVTGRVWSAKKLDKLPAGALLEIELESKGGVIIALDPLGCGEGERVLVVSGEVASKHFTGDGSLVDALVIASLDDAEKSQ